MKDKIQQLIKKIEQMKISVDDSFKINQIMTTLCGEAFLACSGDAVVFVKEISGYVGIDNMEID